MEKHVYISKLKEHIGEEVIIKGWLYNKRESGKIRFLIVRDGTGMVQVVAVKMNLDESIFEKCKIITQESSLILKGKVRKDDRALGGVEIDLIDLEIINLAENYPISLKEHGVEFLQDNRHLWLRSKRQHHIMRVRNEIIKSIRDFFYDREFILIDSPILTGSIGETASTLFQLDYFDLGKAYLSQTGQLYLEAAVMSFGKVYCFGPTFRAENSQTRRHLTEFWMIEGEMAFADNNDNMKIQEEMVNYILERVLSKCKYDLEVLERDITKLEAARGEFIRKPYGEVIKELQEMGSDIKWGDDLGGDDETMLTKKYDKPIFVMNYPKDVKAFYMKINPANDGTVLCSDLLAPEGYGEIIGGSQREDIYDVLLSRIREQKLPEDAYSWYLDLRKYGSVPHSGFGLGVERCVAWICGLSHVRETIPFPRMPRRLNP